MTSKNKKRESIFLSDTQVLYIRVNSMLNVSLVAWVGLTANVPGMLSEAFSWWEHPKEAEQQSSEVKNPDKWSGRVWKERRQIASNRHLSCKCRGKDIKEQGLPTLTNVSLFSSIPLQTFDVVYKWDHHLTSNNIISLCVSPVPFNWVPSYEKQGTPQLCSQKPLGIPDYKIIK